MAAAALARAQQGVIHVNVDASDAPRRLIHVQLAIPAAAGPMTLLYPQWIPGEHAPTGPIADLVALKIRARNQTLPWTRDSANLYAFRVNVPAGSAALDVAFDFISAADAGGFSSGSSITTELAVLSWNQFVLYPQGAASDQLQYQASLRIPRGWRYGTALPVAKESGEEIDPCSEKRESPLLGRFAFPETESFNQERILALPSSFSGVDSRHPLQSLA